MRRFVPVICELAGVLALVVATILSPPAGLAIVGVALLALGYHLGGRE